MVRRVMFASVVVSLLVGAMAMTASAGEVTGNGRLLHYDGKWGTGLHSRSLCAYSGQEDLQFFTDDGDATAKTTVTRGDPGHAQAWGLIPKDVRDYLTSIGLHPGMACNPMRSGGEG